MGKMKDVPAGTKYNGLRNLPTPVRNKMGYKKMGGEEKLLMRAGGMLDFAEMAADKMRYGAEKYGYGKEKMGFGGTTGKKTYSGPNKRKK
jgi:hypothetical protein